jgi:hypothetical protein
MSTIANDGTLVRGSITLTISAVTYVLQDYNRTHGAPRSEMDYDEDGKPAASSHVEDFEHLTGTIRLRSDQSAPPKFTVFSYDSKDWMIIDRTEAGSTEGLKAYTIDAIENISGSVTTS